LKNNILKNTIDLYWFSGSGNSLVIALEVKEFFTSKEKSVRLLPLEKINPRTIKMKGTIGFIIPVAGQSTYPFIWEFIEELPETKDTPCFLIDTLAMYSGGILGPVKKIFKKKGFLPVAATEIRMPNNFQITKRSLEKEKKCIARGKKKAIPYRAVPLKTIVAYINKK
jgi:hypothetical protein